LSWMEQALGLTLEDCQPSKARAPASFGGYQRDAVIEYAGDYVAFRRSFDTPGRIIASQLAIEWDQSAGALRFHEAQDNRSDSGKAYAYRFGGDVLIPPNLGVINLVVRSDDGRVRLMSMSMPREDNGTLMMKGFLLTLNEIQDIGYYPVSSPAFLARRGGNVKLGPCIVDADDPNHGWAETILNAIEKKFLA